MTLSVPLGIVVKVIFMMTLYDTNSCEWTGQSPAVSETISSTDYYTLVTGLDGEVNTTELRIRTNTASEITQDTDGMCSYTEGFTKGWLDRRGRDE